MSTDWTVHPGAGGQRCCIRFAAMASTCEIWVDGAPPSQWPTLAQTAYHEARRIERKWSRYRDDNLIHRINSADGNTVEVDDETARLLDYGAVLFEASEGRFDLTSGVLRRAWRFDGGNRLPDDTHVRQLLEQVGWQRVRWARPHLQMAPGMEIDLGGIGKEYAVDQSLSLLQAHTDAALLVNYGGDLAANRPPGDDAPWRIGIGDDGHPDVGAPLIRLRRGGIATSGDAHRFVETGGVRYGHVLDARTGWPVPGAPHSVTVAAATCSEAGSLSTLAMLSGADAEAFLRNQGVDFHVLRPTPAPDAP